MPTIFILRKQLDDGDWQGPLGLLLPLIGRDPALTFKQAITLNVDGNANDLNVRHLFSAINDVWPLWYHYLALDGSLAFATTALCPRDDRGEITEPLLRDFVSENLAVVADYYQVIGVDHDIASLRDTVLSNLHASGLPIQPVQ